MESRDQGDIMRVLGSLSGMPLALLHVGGSCPGPAQLGKMGGEVSPGSRPLEPVDGTVFGNRVFGAVIELQGGHRASLGPPRAGVLREPGLGDPPETPAAQLHRQRSPTPGAWPVAPRSARLRSSS